jgi:predicted enzyme related to lactoylglutathione lyase
MIMKRVTGIGGIFFEAKNPAELKEWYRRHLGIPIQEWGGAVFPWSDDTGAPSGSTTWSVSQAPAEYFAPGTASFMVNYRVADLLALLAALREEGCDVAEATEESEFGKFGWVIDPEGNKIELWEPPAAG